MICSRCGRITDCDFCGPQIESVAFAPPEVLAEIARAMGRKGGTSGRGDRKRRDVDYAALGRKGGKAGKRKPRE